jgi:hypothetical protein
MLNSARSTTDNAVPFPNPEHIHAGKGARSVILERLSVIEGGGGRKWAIEATGWRRPGLCDHNHTWHFYKRAPLKSLVIWEDKINTT